MATQATGSTAAGTITLVVGNVRIIGVDGVGRVAKVGDKVFAREVIETGADGIIQVQLEGGRFLDVGRDSKLALSSEILAEAGAAGTPAVAPAAGTTPAGAEQDAAAIQKLIAAGADPAQVAAATAAGGAPAAGGTGADGGGGTPVFIDQSSSTGDITSGFPTQPAGITFPEIEPALLPLVEPAVSVVIQPKPEDGVTVSGNAASVIEGTSDTGATKTVNFVITLSEAFDTDVQVTYVIQPGTALTPEDFNGVLTDTITIPAGETQFIVPVNIVQDHLVEDDQNFTIVLTNAVNAEIDPSADSAIVTIINDDTAPTANADTNWAREESSLTAIGNVLLNQPHPNDPSDDEDYSDRRDVDIDGHDALTVIRVEGESGNVGATLQGQYGTLVLNSDGTYTYTLDNNLPAIQRLDDGETRSESFSYTISDGDNAPSSSTLTITIFGSNDVPTITVKTDGDIYAEAANAVVDEEGLATGSNADSNKEFTSGSFKVSDTDGVDDLVSVTINGQTILMGDLVGATIEGEHGIMTITSFSGGVANFTYELTEATEDDAGPETDVFTLTTTDGDSVSDPATVTINIIDDVPSADDDSNSMTEDDVSVSGNVRDNDTQGADRTALVTDGTFEGEFGTLVLNANGSYTYTLNANLDHLDTGESVQEQFPYVLTDADGDPSNAVLTITITGTNDGPVALADTNWVEEDSDFSETSGNVLENQLHSGAPNEGLFRDVADTDVDIENLTVTSVNGQALGGDGEIEIVGLYGTLELHSDGSYTYELNNQNEAVQFLAEGDTLTESFNYTASDGDATAGSTLTITIFGTNDGPQVGSASTRVSEEGLESGIPDTVGNTDTTNSETASGQIAVFDSDGDALTVTLDAPAASPSFTSGGETITWSGDGTKTLTGSIFGGEVDIITITIDDDGNYTVTLLGPVDHDDTSSEDNISITVGVNATDGETTGSGSLVVTIEDDSPTISATGVVPTLTVDETVFATDASASFAGLFDGAFGADGFKDTDNNNVEDADAIAYALGINAGATGLTDTLTGDAVVLSLEGGEVVGRAGAAGPVVFTISVDADTGVVTLNQSRAVVHGDPTDPDEADTPEGLNAGNLVTLTATITDADGDTDTATRNIGGAFKFEDDGPSIEPNQAAVPTLTVDETVFATDASASFAGLFDGAFGADGFKDADDNNVEDADAISYGLSVNAGATGLTDTLTGDAVVLSLEGGDVVGRAGAGGPIVFTISVNENTGEVTLNQSRAVVHGDPTDPDEADTPEGLNANLVTLTATITDGDGDTDTADRDISGAFKFEDDGPSIDPNQAAVPTLTVDETVFATDASASFAGLFTAGAFGADGFKDADDNNVEDADAISYSLGINAGATGLTDTLTGNAVVLSLESGVVVGRAGAAGPIVFTISVNADTGVVTLNQSRAVVHGDPTDPDEADTPEVLNAASLVTLTATITDGDGDTDTATRDIGNAFKFEDDGPSVTVNNTFVYNVDGSFNTGTQSFSFGADGQASTGALVLTSTGGLPDGYSLVQTAPNTWTAVLGTQASDSDPATDLFEVVMNPSQGTYTFTLLHDVPPVAVEIDIDSGLAGGSWFDVNGDPTTNSSEVYTAVIEPSGDNPFRIIASGINEDGAAEIAVGNNTIGVGGDDTLQANDDDEFILSLENTTGEQTTFQTVVMTLQHFNPAQESFEITITGTDTDGDPLTLTYTETSTEVDIVPGVVFSDSDVVTIDVDGVFGSISEISTLATDGVLKVVDFDLNFTVDQNVSDYSFDFLATAKDGDLDTASDPFTVNVLAGTAGNDNLIFGSLNDTVSGGAGNDTINTAAGNDILVGGAGNDILTGGSGSDQFKYAATTEGQDSITDFTIAATASGGDVLNLQDVLAVAGATIDNAVAADNAATVNNYVYFEVSGTTATLHVDPTGGSSGPALATFSVANGTTADSLLQQLLTNNQIVT